MFVLGIDPGVSRCGYCVLEARGTGARARGLGVLRTDPSMPLAGRLCELQGDLRTLIAEHRPDVVVIERVLFQVNVRTAMAVGQVSGLAMAEAAAAGADVIEYSPNQVKEAVAGHGGAGKPEVQQMVQILLGLDEPPRPPDAADAAAVALCHLAVVPLAACTGGAS